MHFIRFISRNTIFRSLPWSSISTVQPKPPSSRPKSRQDFHHKHRCSSFSIFSTSSNISLQYTTILFASAYGTRSICYLFEVRYTQNNGSLICSFSRVYNNSRKCRGIFPQDVICVVIIRADRKLCFPVSNLKK